MMAEDGIEVVIYDIVATPRIVNLPFACAGCGAVIELGGQIVETAIADVKRELYMEPDGPWLPTRTFSTNVLEIPTALGCPTCARPLAEGEFNVKPL